MTTRTRPPTSLHYLERLEWARSFDLTSPSEWVVTCELDGPGENDSKKITATLDGSTFTFLLETETMALGRWRWQTWGSHATSGRRVLAKGEFELLPGLLEGATSAGTSTHNSRMLALIEARLEERLGIDAESYSINNRSLSRVPIAELREMRDHYASRWASERRCLEAGVTPGRRRTVKMGFG